MPNGVFRALYVCRISFLIARRPLFSHKYVREMVDMRGGIDSHKNLI